MSKKKQAYGGHTCSVIFHMVSILDNSTGALNIIEEVLSHNNPIATQHAKEMVAVLKNSLNKVLSETQSIILNELFDAVLKGSVTKKKMGLKRKSNGL